jgi:hypothetical protein
MIQLGEKESKMIHLGENPNLNLSSIDSLDSNLIINSSNDINISFENQSDLEEDYTSNLRRVMTKMLIKNELEELKLQEEESSTNKNRSHYKSRVF